MDKKKNTSNSTVWVAIDISKHFHQILVSSENNKKRVFKISNTMEGFNRLKDEIFRFGKIAIADLEPTGNYHRALAYFLQKSGIKVVNISSVALARTREVIHNSWDKNDPKDASVILHLLKQNQTQYYFDPVLEGTNDIQEISKTYTQIAQRKMKVQHSILNHYLPLYFPEMEKFLNSNRAYWFGNLLIEFPLPKMISKFSFKEFKEKAWSLIPSKARKDSLLVNIYEVASKSVGLPVPENSESVNMFRTILKEHLDLSITRRNLEKNADNLLMDNPDYKLLKSIPGMGSVSALSVLAEAGDLRRFRHYKQFLKFCGFDLSTQRSGMYRGVSKLSKRGNARLRTVFWLAATTAIRLEENSFRDKFTRYIKSDPKNKDLKRKVYTAVSAKVARVAHGIIKSGKPYQRYYGSNLISG